MSLTLMAVHAHPDDEVLFTGGILAKYAKSGVNTVLVTCTGGELGFCPDGVFYGTDDHDQDVAKALREANLKESVRRLGVDHLELLGYHDSGMAGWPENELPGCFFQAEVEVAAAKLALLLDQYRPDVLVTYDVDGFYGHPDHIQAHRITTAAARKAALSKLYFFGVPRSELAAYVKVATESSMELPEWLLPSNTLGTEDSAITTSIDCSAVCATKFRALGAHKSQLDLAPLLDMGEELFAQIFSLERFRLTKANSSIQIPEGSFESDLFAGISDNEPPMGV